MDQGHAWAWHVMPVSCDGAPDEREEMRAARRRRAAVAYRFAQG